jgi:hypothetical protein
VVEIATQNNVIRVEIGLIDPSLELGSIVGGAWGVYIDNG